MYIVYSKTLCLDKTSLVIGAKLQRHYRYVLLYYYTLIGQQFSHGNTCTLHWVNSVYLLFTCSVRSCIVIRCICVVKFSCLVCLFQLSCMFVSFTCPSPCVYRSLVQVLCVFSSWPVLFFHFTCPLNLVFL